MDQLFNSRAFLFLAGVTLGVLLPLVYQYLKNPPKDLLKCPFPEELEESIISIPKAQEMYANYTDRRVIPLIRNEENEDYVENKHRGDHPISITRHTHFEFSIIKSYIDYLSCLNQKLISQGQEGIKSLRIYFAHYPLSGAFADATPVKSDPDGNSYKGQNTIMMLPTSIFDGSESGFMIHDDLNNIEIDTIRNNRNGYNSLILNEAGLTPPPPQADDFGG